MYFFKIKKNLNAFSRYKITYICGKYSNTIDLCSKKQSTKNNKYVVNKLVIFRKLFTLLGSVEHVHH